jgi:hypothetical protein
MKKPWTVAAMLAGSSFAIPDPTVIEIRIDIQKIRIASVGDEKGPQ